MTSSNSNPYAPAAPLDPPAEPIDEAIHFNGAVRWDDIERLGREGLGIYAGILVWPITAAFYFGFIWLSDAPNRTLPRGGQWLGDMPVHPLWLIAFVAHAGASMWITMRIMGHLYARSSMTAVPDLIGPLSGNLHADSIELVYPHAHQRLPLGTISQLRRSLNGIGLILGEDRLGLVVLPRHLFEEQEFAKARDRFGAAIHRSQSLTVVPASINEPLSGESQRQILTAKPDGADAFASGVRLSDCQWTPAYREQVAWIYGLYGGVLFNAMTIWLPVAILTQTPVMRWHIFAVQVGMIVLFLLVYCVVAFWRIWSIKSSTLVHVSGWISSDGLTINSPLGSTTYDPRAFERVVSSERSVQLILPGQHQQTLVLSKPMFQSAGGFDRLRLWASS